MTAWIGSVRKIAFPLITFGLGALTKLAPNLTIKDYTGAGMLIFVLLCIEEYFAGIRPSAQLNEIAPLAMDTASAPLRAALQAQSIDVRMSVFRAVRPAGTLWCQRRFKMMWNINMTDNPDVNLSFPVKNGVSGACFSAKAPLIADATGIASYPLPPKILAKLGGVRLTAVACCPIYERKKSGKQSGKVIGVLNLDSSDLLAYTVFVNPAYEVSRNMKQLAGLASHIFR